MPVDGRVTELRLCYNGFIAQVDIGRSESQCVSLASPSPCGRKMAIVVERETVDSRWVVTLKSPVMVIIA